MANISSPSADLNRVQTSKTDLSPEEQAVHNEKVLMLLQQSLKHYKEGGNTSLSKIEEINSYDQSMNIN